MLDTLDAKGYDVSAARVDFASLSSSQILMDNVEAEVDCRAPQSEANAAFASMVSSAIHVVAPQQCPITLVNRRCRWRSCEIGWMQTLRQC